MGRSRGSGSRGSSRGSSGLFSRGSSTKTAPRTAPPPAAPRRNQPPQQAHSNAPVASQPQPSMGGGGLGSIIMQGMAFGTGSAIAHRAVDAVAGPRTVQHQFAENKNEDGSAVAPAAADSNAVAPLAAADGSAEAARRNPCEDQTVQFGRCVQENNNNVGSCQFYFDILSKCQQDVKDNARWQ